MNENVLKEIDQNKEFMWNDENKIRNIYHDYCCCRCHCYLLGKGGYVFGSVGLSVCLFVCLWTNITQKVIYGLG